VNTPWSDFLSSVGIAKILLESGGRNANAGIVCHNPGAGKPSVCSFVLIYC
jgi:hypothetical protein